MAADDDRRYVRVPETLDLARICRALNAVGARYILIGGFAVIAHGLGRPTKDIDLLIDDSPANVARVKEGLAVLEDNAAAEIDPGDVQRYTVVRVADEVLVDLMGRACGVTLAEAEQDAEIIEIEGVPIPVASKRTLIRTKHTLRPSDHSDVAYLEALLRSEEP